MDAALDREVRRRAGELCEYCRLPQAYHRKRFHIDHIIARKHGGPTIAMNLALCCSHCNLHKETDLTGIDPETSQITRLYSPRQDRWNDHFMWNGAIAVGLTAIGRATVAVLKMNSGLRVSIRSELISANLFPPPEQLPDRSEEKG